MVLRDPNWEKFYGLHAQPTTTAQRRDVERQNNTAGKRCLLQKGNPARTDFGQARTMAVQLIQSHQALVSLPRCFSLEILRRHLQRQPSLPRQPL